MTDTYDTDLDLINQTDAALRRQLKALLEGPKTESDPPDKWARAVSALTKARDENEARRARLESKIAAKTHTRYEDMPPPTPEDEARFHARFEKLIGEIIDERGEA